jgi:hypothetical protein
MQVWHGLVDTFLTTAMPHNFKGLNEVAKLEVELWRD